MPRGYRRVILAVVGWVALSGANDAKLPKHSAQRDQARAQQQIANAAGRAAAALDKANSPKPADGGCDPDKEDRKSDLCAQWKAADAAEESADWAARAFWLGFLGTALLLWTLLYTARGTRAATDAVETQINADRPLMQLTNVLYCKFDPFHEMVTFEWGYEVKNLGGTACWTEQFKVFIGTSVDDADVILDHPMHAFIAPDKGLTTIGQGHRIGFRQKELEEFADHNFIFCIGSVTYRNAAGIRWESGFAVRSHIKGGISGAFNPVPHENLWFDRKLPKQKRSYWSRRRKN